VPDDREGGPAGGGDRFLAAPPADDPPVAVAEEGVGPGYPDGGLAQDAGEMPVAVAGGPAAFLLPGGIFHPRWTGRTLRVEIEGWVDPELPVSGADALGQQVARAVASEVPEAGSFTWTARAAPA
jgi:hypothetical protein